VDEQSLKRQALFLLALGKCRGLLYSVRAGDVNVDVVDQILRVTSLAHLAEVLGVAEEEIALDVDQHLSRAEQLRMSP
jgi:hypothetical protein